MFGALLLIVGGLRIVDDVVEPYRQFQRRRVPGSRADPLDGFKDRADVIEIVVMAMWFGVGGNELGQSM